VPVIDMILHETTGPTTSALNVSIAGPLMDFVVSIKHRMVKQKLQIAVN